MNITEKKVWSSCKSMGMWSSLTFCPFHQLPRCEMGIWNNDVYLYSLGSSPIQTTDLEKTYTIVHLITSVYKVCLCVQLLCYVLCVRSNSPTSTMIHTYCTVRVLKRYVIWQAKLLAIRGMVTVDCSQALLQFSTFMMILKLRHR